MVQQWIKPREDEKLFVDEQARAHEVLRTFQRDAPPPLQNERLDQYERRLTYEVQKYAPNYKDINLYQAEGDAYRLLKKQVYADAQQEARHPTNIPDGELREVVSYDQAGRPSYSYFGKPRVWMSEFAFPAKKLIGIQGDGARFSKP